MHREVLVVVGTDLVAAVLGGHGGVRRQPQWNAGTCGRRGQEIERLRVLFESGQVT
jgi:hypothetical protein